METAITFQLSICLWLTYETTIHQWNKVNCECTDNYINAHIFSAEYSRSRSQSPPFLLVTWSAKLVAVVTLTKGRLSYILLLCRTK